MDGLSIAASIIAVIQLAGQVTCLGYGYIGKVKQAPKYIQDLIDELTSLSKVLGVLEKYVRSTNSAKSDALQTLDGPLRGCALELKKLESRLKPSMRRWTRMLGSLKWPMKEAKVLQVITRIERHKSLFLIALNIDHISLFQADSMVQASQRDMEEFVLTAGAGKTFLSSAVVDHFQSQAQDKGYGVAYFYFNYKEKAHQSPNRVLGSLIKQLASQLLKLPTELSSLYQELDSGNKRPTTKNLYVALLSILKFFGQAFLIFDALDECDQDQRKELLPVFHGMVEAGASLFITSRQYPEDIQESFRDTAKIELSAQSDDIRSYIEEKIEENARAKRLVKQGKFGERIVLELIDCAKGMFLAVRFHVEYLCQQTTAKQILMALENPKNSTFKERPLDPTYDRVVESILKQPESCANLAIGVLSWLVYAKRILTVKEIQVAVSIELGRYELDELDLPDRKTLLDVCFGLATIDENSDTIRLSHLTVHEYLLRHSIIPETAKLKIAIACTTYCSFDSLAEVSYEKLKGQEGFWKAQLALYPFLEYSACYMPSHLRACDERLTQDFVLKFLERPRNVSLWILASYFIRKYKSYWYSSWYTPRGRHLGTLELSQSWTRLGIASKIGHFILVQQILGDGDNDPAAVGFAAGEGHNTVVKLLIDNGADISIAGSKGRLPLHLAALKGSEVIVKLLLDTNADISTEDMNKDTSLHLAAKKGHEEVARLLLDRGADSSVKNSYGWTALCTSAENGHEVVSRLLLDRGADYSVKDNSGRTALHISAEYGHETVVRLLLDRGADYSVKDNSWRTALHISAGNGHETVVRLLLDRGADYSVKDNSGQTALYISAEYGHETVVRLLLDRGADYSVKNNSGQTALYISQVWGCEAVASLLIDRGANFSKTW